MILQISIYKYLLLSANMGKFFALFVNYLESSMSEFRSVSESVFIVMKLNLLCALTLSRMSRSFDVAGGRCVSHYVSHQRFGLHRPMRADSLTGNRLTFCLFWYVLFVWPKIIYFLLVRVYFFFFLFKLPFVFRNLLWKELRENCVICIHR